jgi:hypothetical protein
MQSPVPPTEELIFERLLAGLLEAGGGPEADGVDAPPELLVLRDMARRLRASVQWMPLPRSRLALRRALLATVEAARPRPAAFPRLRYLPAAWRRTGRWMTAVTAATFLMMGAVLGAHALEMALSPSGPLYGITLQIDAMRVQLAGDAMHRAATLLDVTRARAAEIGASAYGDDPRGVEEAAAALERQNGWLRRVARSLPAAEQERFAPAAAKSDTLAVTARRAAQLRMGGLLPSGVTMVDLLNAAAGPLSGAATTDVSGPPDGSRGPQGGAHNDAATGGDTSGGRMTRESGLGGGAAAAGQSGGASLSGGSGGAGGSLGESGASAGSHKSGGDVDTAPPSGSGVNGAPGGRGDVVGVGSGSSSSGSHGVGAAGDSKSSAGLSGGGQQGANQGGGQGGNGGGAGGQGSGDSRGPGEGH